MSQDSSNHRSKGRQKFLPIVPPKRVADHTDVDRDHWIEMVCTEFVSPSKANKNYYRVVLETLWPQGHGMPGPHVRSDQLRDAIDDYRKMHQKDNKPYKPYIDAFRRIRELQGEEGVIGITKEGNTYQLVDLELASKRIPRVNLSNEQWENILEKYNYKCAICGRDQSEIRFDQDHKIPRVRQGDIEESNDINNWQPLCGECNNFKSTACRGCNLDCNTCCWAFPEKYAPLRISSENIQLLRQHALKYALDPHDLLNELIPKFFINV